MSYLSKVLDHASSKNVELELRFLLNRNKKYPKFVHAEYGLEQIIAMAKQLINNLGEDMSMEQTMNFIINDPNNKDKYYFKQMVFNNGVQAKAKKGYYFKERMNPVYLTGVVPIKLGVAEEGDATEKEFNAMSERTDLIRAKLRISIENTKMKGWRLDITLVKTLSGSADINLLKKVRNNLFKDVDVNNFVETAPWDFADDVEIEIERTAKSTTEADLKISDFVWAHVHDTKSDSYVVKIAEWIDSRNVDDYKSGKRVFKNLGNAVVELDFNIYTEEVLPNLSKMSVVEKADGERAFIYVSKGDSKIVLSKSNINLETDAKDVSIADAEYIGDKAYIFDVIVWEGKNISVRDFSERKKFIDKYCPCCCTCYKFLYIHLKNLRDKRLEAIPQNPKNNT